MKVITLTALSGTILLSVFGAFSEVHLTNGTLIGGLYYFIILAGAFFIPLFILTWIYNAILLKLTKKNFLYRMTIGILIALSALLVFGIVDKVPDLGTVYFFIGSGILITVIHLLLEKKINIE